MWAAVIQEGLPPPSHRMPGCTMNAGLSVIPIPDGGKQSNFSELNDLQQYFFKNMHVAQNKNVHFVSAVFKLYIARTINSKDFTKVAQSQKISYS